ncbi:hypothetical protein [Dyadobacter arcticus]|uniref:Uncharacterized membrane protein YozB (DUF420 family) n=1 Tax=Dyadobacter arcticus TaxID=1078754 RepID=A0ABX0US37_9BACT|nr:hypothetical protein [Dyadobacter arcticus]NIJ54440.1 uncharacterized membrane protein YozB (DUF420 family) [Dyadobacter arcticus]
MDRLLTKKRTGRYFFVAMAIVFPILVMLGFVPDYQMIASGQIKVHWFLHVHGVIMTAWLGIFLAQSLLIANDNVKRHRQLGQIGFIFGILVWISLVIITVRALIVNNPPEADGQFDILFIQLQGLVLFGIFFTWGMWVRKKNIGAHKRLLLLATVIILQAAVDRIRFLPGLQYAIFIRFLYLDLLLIPLFIYDWISVRRIHRMTLLGTLLICVVQAGITFGWGSPVWHRFWYNAITPLVERLPEVNLDNAQSDLLIGHYGDAKWHLTVSRNAGKLYLQLPGQDKWELGATSETQLFVRIMNWKLNFVKGPDGKVEKLINDQIFTVWEVPKMP